MKLFRLRAIDGLICFYDTPASRSRPRWPRGSHISIPPKPRLVNWKVFDGQGAFFTIAHGALLVACYYFDIVWVKIYEHLAPCWLRSNWLLNYFVAGFPPVANGPLANATPVISGSRGCTGKLDCVAPYHRGGWRIKLTSYVFGTAGHWLRSQQRIYDFICQPSCQRQRAGV